MNIEIDETHIAWLVMGYLKDRNMYESLSSFQLETGLCDNLASDDVKYIQQLTLQGRWDDLLRYLQPIRSVLLQKFDEVLLLIHRQKYLEALTWQGGGGHRHALLPWKPNPSQDELDSDEMLALLKSLEHVASKQEFNVLCECMTLEKLSDHPSYRSWTVSKGRIETFHQLRQLIHHVLPDDILPTHRQSSSSSGLLAMISLALSQQCNAAASLTKSAVWNDDLRMPVIMGSDVSTSSSHLIIISPISNKLYPSAPDANYHNTSEHNMNHQVSEAKDDPSTIKSSSSSSSRPATSHEHVVPRQPVSWTVDIPPSSSSAPQPHPPTLPSNRPRSASRGKVSLAEAMSQHAPKPSSSSINHEDISIASKLSADSHQHQHPITANRIASHPPQQRISSIPTKNSSHPSHKTRDVISSAWKGTEIFQSACPLRCSALVSTSSSSSSCQLAVGSNAKSIHMFDVTSSSTSSQSPAVKMLDDQVDVHKGSIYAMDCISSSSHHLLATGSNDKAIRIWNVTTREWSAPCKGHTGTVRAVKFGEESHQLVSAGAGDYRPRLWDPKTGSCILTLPGHEAAVHALLWMDTTTVLSGCEAGTAIAHDLRSGIIIWKQRLLQGKDVVREHQGICCMETYGGSLAVAGCTGGNIALFDMRTGMLIHHERLHGDDIRAIATLPSLAETSSPYLLTTSFDGTAGIWHLNHLPATGSAASGATRPSFDSIAMLSGVHTDKVLSVATGMKGRAIFTTGADGRVVSWHGV